MGHLPRHDNLRKDHGSRHIEGHVAKTDRPGTKYIKQTMVDMDKDRYKDTNRN